MSCSNAQLLREVKRNAFTVPASSSYDSDASWGAAQWQLCFESLFLKGVANNGGARLQADDLLFFVWKNPEVGQAPFTARRWSPRLPEGLISMAHDVDWHKTVFLNLIAHTEFELALAVCKYER
eukprot:CAMPEP_0177754008 /NCGR_PEP_ID=MMETSP0491_2-20121128/1775_1 /TAXON_ID=63592 /ORGANISM="Tetraselmis chuii, Strain PLY429" /LENGTH=123 /DNA_ID=CAMNT_0019269353 /DNA_START=174 /DNA_END=545 /DNA_ORIENTATION=-